MPRVRREPAEAPRFLSVAAAAHALGTSEMTLYRAIQAGEFPAIRIRGRLIVPARALDVLAEAAIEANGLVDAAEWANGGAA
jgi:excisionase family DNA binding protein